MHKVRTYSESVWCVCVCACVRACVCACVRACVRACVCACVCACVRACVRACAVHISLHALKMCQEKTWDISVDIDLFAHVSALLRMCSTCHEEVEDSWDIQHQYGHWPLWSTKVNETWYIHTYTCAIHSEIYITVNFSTYLTHVTHTHVTYDYVYGRSVCVCMHA